MKVRPDVSASLAAGLANEACLEIGNPDVIRPSVRAERNRMAALMIRVIDQDAAHASRTHFAESDLPRGAARRHGGGRERWRPVRSISGSAIFAATWTIVEPKVPVLPAVPSLRATKIVHRLLK